MFRGLTLVLAVLVAACAPYKSITDIDKISGSMKMGPDFENVMPAKPADYDRWWTALGSEELNGLMEKMFSDSYRVASAYEGLNALYAAYGVTEADRGFTLNAKANTSGSLSYKNDDTQTTDSYGLGLTASYEADLWGRLKNTSKANLYSLMSGRYDLESLYMTLSAELAGRYVTYVSLAKQLQTKQDGLKLYQDMHDARERLYRAGVGDMTKLLEAKKNLETAQNAVITLKQQISDAGQAVALLTGQPDGRLVDIKADGFSMPKLPETIPSKVAAQRPDILSAAYAVYRYDSTAAAAAAARYPSLNFTADAGYTSDGLSSLITPENFAAQIIGSLILPVIDSGARKAEYERQQSLLRKSIFDYQQTVIEGLNEVQKALTNNRYSLETLNSQMERLDSDIKLLKLAQMRYELGIDDYSSVLETKITLNERAVSVLSAENTLALARIELFRAVGGDWAAGYFEKRLNDPVRELFKEQIQ